MPSGGHSPKIRCFSRHDWSRAGSTQKSVDGDQLGLHLLFLGKRIKGLIERFDASRDVAFYVNIIIGRVFFDPDIGIQIENIETGICQSGGDLFHDSGSIQTINADADVGLNQIVLASIHRIDMIAKTQGFRGGGHNFFEVLESPLELDHHHDGEIISQTGHGGIAKIATSPAQGGAQSGDDSRLIFTHQGEDIPMIHGNTFSS
jgi:hypothetical protein